MAMRKKSQKTNSFQIIKDYWNGNFSLVKSFWIGFIVIGSIVSVPAFIYTDTYIDSLGNTGLMGLFLYFIILYSYLILAYVGTWRSASNYKPKKDQWSWGTIAKVYIVLSAIRALVELFI